MKGRQQIDKWLSEEAAGLHSSCFWYRDAASVASAETDQEWQELAKSMKAEMEAIAAGSRTKQHDI